MGWGGDLSELRISEFKDFSIELPKLKDKEEKNTGKKSQKFQRLWDNNKRDNSFEMAVKVKATQSCLTLCDLMDYTIHGILQARRLEWVAFPFSRGY